MMKRPKTLAITAAAIAILLTSSAVFADQTKSTAPNAGTYTKTLKGDVAKLDPAQMLEKQKANLQKKVADGKMTQEEADKAIAQMEQKIKEMQDFQNMTLEQKKEKLLADYKAKLDQWDGSGNAPFFGKGFEGIEGFKGKEGFDKEKGEFRDNALFGKGSEGNMDPAQMLEKQKANLQQRVADGKMTQEEADKAIAQMEQKVKEMQDFNALTPEQKKEKLLNEFTTSTNERVTAGKLTQEKADQAIADFKAKLDKWDGTGNMPFVGKGGEGREGFAGKMSAGKGSEMRSNNNTNTKTKTTKQQ